MPRSCRSALTKRFIDELLFYRTGIGQKKQVWKGPSRTFPALDQIPEREDLSTWLVTNGSPGLVNPAKSEMKTPGIGSGEVRPDGHVPAEATGIHLLAVSSSLSSFVIVRMRLHHGWSGVLVHLTVDARSAKFSTPNSSSVMLDPCDSGVRYAPSDRTYATLIRCLGRRRVDKCL